MPTITKKLTATIQDGHTTFGGRTNAYDVNSGVNYATPFFGPQGSNGCCGYFCFEIENLPQGSQITEAKLGIYMDTSNYTNGSSSRIYLAVDNNLDVEPTAGGGRIVRGTKGKTPWDRLGRITEAVSSYGNRCGPTHIHPSGLSNYGASVRDPYALMIKAFCTDQTTASATGRSLAVNTMHWTEDFAQCLQPLVDDPNWNGSSQWVMIYVFSDDTATGSTEWGVGNLSGLTYYNGLAPSTATTTGQGRIAYYNSGNSDSRHPTLTVSFETTDPSALTGAVKSFGYAPENKKPNLIARWYGDRIENESYRVAPGDGGAGDIPFTSMSSTLNPYSAAWGDGTVNPASNVKLGTSARSLRPQGRPLIFNDFAGQTSSATWDFAKFNHNTGTTELEDYSFRMYFNPLNGSFAGVAPYVVQFRNGVAGSNAFAVQLNEYDIISGSGYKMRLTSSSGSTSWTSTSFNQLSGSNYYRLEIQVRREGFPKVFARVYLNDNTTPIETLTLTPSSTKCTSIVIGDNLNTAGLGLFSMGMSDMELWDDFNLGYQFPPDAHETHVGSPVKRKPWKFYVLDTPGDSSTAREAYEVGQVVDYDEDTEVPEVDFSKKLAFSQRLGLRTSGDITWTKTSSISYGSGSSRTLDLYVPDGTPPAGGWPVIVFAHGGFFVGGSRSFSGSEMTFVESLLSFGLAVASIDYTLGGVYLDSLGQSYPAYNASSPTGWYLSFILNYKEAMRFLYDNASSYSLNKDKIIASGHSAGGYIAMAAASSVGLTYDSQGRNLTLSGNVSEYGTPNLPDVPAAGIYTWNAPVNMASLVEYDPTVGWDYSVWGTHRMRGVARIFCRLRADNGSITVPIVGTGVDEIIALNDGGVPPIGYAFGDSDFLVPSSKRVAPEFRQAEILLGSTDSLASPPPIEVYEMPNSLHHTGIFEDTDWTQFSNWIHKYIF